MLEKSANKLVLLVILLNSADTFFTSLALDHGVTEWNPAMATVLTYGITWFLFSKLILVNLLILFVGMVGRSYYIGRIGMVIASCVYSALIVYHILNMSLIFTTGSLP